MNSLFDAADARAFLIGAQWVGSSADRARRDGKMQKAR
jgi:hypothetical protein